MGEEEMAKALQEKITPYLERIQELEKNIEEKENEAAILRLAVQRLEDIVKTAIANARKKRR